MSGVEENKNVNAATNYPPGESPPANPPNPEGSGEPAPANPPNPDGPGESPPDNSPDHDDSGSGSSFPDIDNDNALTVITQSSAPGRLETCRFKKKPIFMAGYECDPITGFSTEPYISLSERMRLEELNNPPERPRELTSSEEEIIHTPSSDDDPNRYCL